MVSYIYDTYFYFLARKNTEHYRFSIFGIHFSIFTASHHFGESENESRSTSFSVIWKSPLPRLSIYTPPSSVCSLFVRISSICVASFASFPDHVSCTSSVIKKSFLSLVPASIIQLSISPSWLPCSIALLMSSSVMSIKRPLHGWWMAWRSNMLQTKSRIIFDLLWSASKSIWQEIFVLTFIPFESWFIAAS